MDLDKSALLTNLTQDFGEIVVLWNCHPTEERGGMISSKNYKIPPFGHAVLPKAKARLLIDHDLRRLSDSPQNELDMNKIKRGLSYLTTDENLFKEERDMWEKMPDEIKQNALKKDNESALKSYQVDETRRIPGRSNVDVYFQNPRETSSANEDAVSMTSSAKQTIEGFTSDKTDEAHLEQFLEAIERRLAMIEDRLLSIEKARSESPRGKKRGRPPKKKE